VQTAGGVAAPLACEDLVGFRRRGVCADGEPRSTQDLPGRLGRDLLLSGAGSAGAARVAGPDSCCTARSGPSCGPSGPGKQSRFQ